MLLPRDLISGTYRKPKCFLCETDKTKICQLETFNMNGSFKFNSYSELSFDVARIYNNIVTGETKVNPYYDKVEGVRLVYLENFGYFELQDPKINGDGIKEIKSITANSLEYTLSQKYLEKFYVNTGEVDSIEVMYAEDHSSTTITPVTLYNQANPELSLLHLVFEKAHGWRIGHVDLALQTMSRQFDIERESIYDFIMNEICTAFNCYAIFDTVNNTVSLYADSITNKFIGDGVTNEFVISPIFLEIGTVSIDGYKTTDYTYNAVTGTLTLGSAPLSGMIIEVSDGALSSWETDVFVTFDNLAQEMNVGYSTDDIKTVLTVKGADDLDIREVNNGLPYIVDLSYYYNQDWMGEDLYTAYTNYLAKCTQYQKDYKLNAEKILEYSGQIWYEKNRLSLQYSETSVTSSTVGTYYVRGKDSGGGYYYTEVSLPSEWIAGTTYYSIHGSNLNETKVENLYEALKKYYNEGDMSGFDSTLRDDFSFMETHTISSLITTLKSSSSTAAAKDKKVIAFFEEMWDQIGLTPLETLYYTPYKTVQTINVSAGWAGKNSANYGLYYPVVLLLESIETVIAKKKSIIDGITDTMSQYTVGNTAIGNTLLIENNFTDQQLVRLSSFLREDEYIDNNFVETGNETSAKLFKTKQELLECGRVELSKLCAPRLQFSMSLANIYALPEFAPIVSQFQLGNLIKVALRPDYIKHTRLMQVDINFEDFSDFSCEFGDLSSIRSQTDLHADLLSQAVSAGKTVAGSASYWDKGTDTATEIDLRVQQGLLNAATEIKAIDGTQNTFIDKYGMHLQRIDPETGEVDPKQGWIVNNKILYSDDAFKTTKTVLGEYTIDNQTYWGLLADAVIAGYIEGSTIKGSEIHGGTINIGDGTFVVDSNGSVVMNAGSIKGYATSGDLETMVGQISLAGKTIDLTADEIAITSTNFKVDKDGSIEATSGNIAGWDIDSNYLIKDITIDNVDYQTYIQAPDGTSAINAIAVRNKNHGSNTWDTQFSVDYQGKLIAKNANITGDIVANSLTLGSGALQYSQISGTPNLNVYIKKDGTVGSTPSASTTGFKVSTNGLLTASNAVIYGDIYASGGTIAGYTIGDGGSFDNAIYKRVSGSSAKYEVGMKASSGATDLAFYVKKSTDNWASNSNVFYINQSGKLYAQDADIKGTINATSGTFKGELNGATGTFSGSLSAATGTFAGSLSAATGTFKGSLSAASGTFKGSLVAASGSFTELTAGHIDTSYMSLGTSRFYIGNQYNGCIVISPPGYIDESGTAWEDVTLHSRHGILNYGDVAVGNLGLPNSLWDLLYVKNGAVQSSDRNVKKDIMSMGDIQEDLFDSLKPVTFKFNDTKSHRTHYGFISQDVEDSLMELGLTGEDFAGFCKDTIKNDDGEAVEKYSLRYTEFIALNTYMIQKLKQEILELKKEIKELKEMNSSTSSKNIE